MFVEYTYIKTNARRESKCVAMIARYYKARYNCTIRCSFGYVVAQTVLATIVIIFGSSVKFKDHDKRSDYLMATFLF